MSSYLAKPQRFLIRPAPGWIDETLIEANDILTNPLQSYKFKPVTEVDGGVVVVSECDYRQSLELIARLSTAHDVEWIIHSGRVNSRADWSAFFEKSGVGGLFSGGHSNSFRVSVAVSHPVVGTAKDVKKIALNVWNVKADVDGHDELEDDGHSIGGRIRIDSAKNRTRILVSMAGEPLFKRGYKAMTSIATAPLPEHHASACFMWAAHKLKTPLINGIRDGGIAIAVPFAGTGTTGFESLCRSLDYAPGVSRKHYSCEDFAFHPVATMKTIRMRLNARMKSCERSKIIFGDLNGEVCASLVDQVKSFRESVNSAVEVDIAENDFLSDPERLVAGLVDLDKLLFLPLNPPYGLRLARQTGAASIYERLGRALSRLAQTRVITGYVICPDEESWQILLRQLKPFACQSRHFTHGGHDTRLVVFESKT